MGDTTRHIRSISNYSAGGGGNSGGFSRGGQQQNPQDHRPSQSFQSGFDVGGFGMPIQPPLQFHDIKIVKLFS